MNVPIWVVLAVVFVAGVMATVVILTVSSIALIWSEMIKNARRTKLKKELTVLGPRSGDIRDDQGPRERK